MKQLIPPVFMPQPTRPLCYGVRAVRAACLPGLPMHKAQELNGADISASILSDVLASQNTKLDWRKSIGRFYEAARSRDSSLSARRELAKVPYYNGNMNASARPDVAER